MSLIKGLFLKTKYRIHEAWFPGRSRKLYNSLWNKLETSSLRALWLCEEPHETSLSGHIHSSGPEHVSHAGRKAGPAGLCRSCHSLILSLLCLSLFIPCLPDVIRTVILGMFCDSCVIWYPILLKDARKCLGRKLYWKRSVVLASHSTPHFTSLDFSTWVWGTNIVLPGYTVWSLSGWGMRKDISWPRDLGEAQK